MLKEIFSISVLIVACSAASLNPIITNWKNSTGAGYGGYTADITKIAYGASYVFISCNSIPTYSIGPWSDNPNTPLPQGWSVKFPLTPSYSSTKTETKMGLIGLWTNGLGIYNAKDGYSYNSLGVWNRNAYFWEYSS